MHVPEEDRLNSAQGRANASDWQCSTVLFTLCHMVLAAHGYTYRFEIAATLRS